MVFIPFKDRWRAPQLKIFLSKISFFFFEGGNSKTKLTFENINNIDDDNKV